MLTTLCTLGGLLLLLNVPMFVLMVATSAVIIWAYHVAPLMLIATQMFGSIDKFALMAIPFFIFGASIMGAGGLTTRLIAWVEAMVGWVRGGLAYTTILTLMRILKSKGYLTSRKEGRAYVFLPKVDRDTVARKAARQLVSRFFGGSPGELVLSFLREEELTPEELDEIKRKILESGDERHET